MMVIIDNIKDEITSNLVWDNEIHNTTKQCKSNSLSRYSHHGTPRFAYSFGNKPLYDGNINDSSVGLYAHKSKIDNKKLLLIIIHTRWNIFVHPKQ